MHQVISLSAFLNRFSARTYDIDTFVLERRDNLDAFFHLAPVHLGFRSCLSLAHSILSLLLLCFFLRTSRLLRLLTSFLALLTSDELGKQLSSASNDRTTELQCLALGTCSLKDGLELLLKWEWRGDVLQATE